MERTMSQYTVLDPTERASITKRDGRTASFDLDVDPSKWLQDSSYESRKVSSAPSGEATKSGRLFSRQNNKIDPSLGEKIGEDEDLEGGEPSVANSLDQRDGSSNGEPQDHPSLVVKKSDDEKEGDISVFSELLRFAKLSAPNTIVMFFMYLQWTATLSIAAKYLGTEEMSGVSLASLTANLSGLTVVYGLLTAVDTLAPQSFGAGNLAEVGILVQRGIVTVFATFIVTAIIWYNAEDILLGLGQPKNESRLAAIFLRYHFLSVPALALWESSRRFMWSQDVTQWPFVIITVASLGVHLLALNLLLPVLAFTGTPIAHVITNWAMVMGVALWIRIKRPHNPDTWHVNREVVMNRQAMKTFLKLAVPGILSMSEWVFFEFFIFLSGTLGPKALAANSVAYTLIPMSYTIPSGLSIATTARVGALLAQGRVKAAKSLTRAVGIVTICLATLIMTIVYFGQNMIIGAFSSDEDVQALAKSIWLYLSIFLFLDATFGVQCGLLRALGLQLLYACLVFICLFLIGLPVIASLAFPWGSDLGLLGMWYGMPGSYILLNVAMFVAHMTRNWTKYSEEIVERERLTKALRQQQEQPQQQPQEIGIGEDSERIRSASRTSSVINGI